MGVFERMANYGHEQVVFCYDRTTGMKAIIAIHDTTLGPARGGTRFKTYQSEDEALEDVLRLSSGMTYKFAYTDMPRGGGKAVVLDDPSNPTDKPTLLRVFGRFVQLLAGRFGTGPDLGTSSRDMVHLAAETEYVWALDETHGGTGDSSPLTAEGVLAGIQVALGHVTGTPALEGRRVAVQGLGGVGGRLAQLLVRGGAVVTGADADPARAKEIAGELGISVEDPERLFDVECDVFSPNAIGGVLNEHTIPRLRCKVVAGGANNQLATPEDGRRLFERGILYAPDYVINSAAPYAVIGAGELGYSRERLAASVNAVAEALEVIFRRAQAEGRPSAEIADRIARGRGEGRGRDGRRSRPSAVTDDGTRGPAQAARRGGAQAWNTLTWFRSRRVRVDDQEIVNRINRLVDEEHELEKTHVGRGLSPAETERLRSVEVQLDQCWDLLRQRRARREFGQNPDDAIVRDPDTVERYQQ